MTKNLGGNRFCLTFFLLSTFSMKVTRFKCGGISLGLSWAHVLGDAYSASDYLNRWAQIATSMQSNGPPKTTIPISPTSKNLETQQPIPKELPFSLKRVDPVGDHWISTTNTKLATFSFHVTSAQIANLKNKILGPFFESLCAIIWQSIAKVRRQCEPKIVTLIKNNPKRAKGDVNNSQIISTVEADFSPEEADPHRLAGLLAEQASNETAKIEKAAEIDHGTLDFIVYGANLTFVDWQEANLYGLELQGQKPDFVWYSIQGVGRNGVVLVLPGSKEFAMEDKSARLVTLILPQEEVSEVKCELENYDLLLAKTIE